jgi:histidinol dehydrogenase
MKGSERSSKNAKRWSEKSMKVIKSTSRNFSKQLGQLAGRLALQDPRVEKTVQAILRDIRRGGDRAVIKYTRKFDRLSLTPATLKVDPEQIQEAYRQADPVVVESLKLAARRISEFHERQKTKSWSYQDNGVTLGQRVYPLERAGLYVPGGKAAYPSSVLMNAIPAKVAEVEQILMCSPTPGDNMNPYVLIAADLVGIRDIYRIGGVQAIGAMAFGTQTIPKVDKIVGPGNQYVTAAKRLVYGWVDIDLVAGPSEILVIADETTNPVHLAADLLSQAEHDEEAWTILVTPSNALVRAVVPEINRQLQQLPRRALAQKSLKAHGLIIMTRHLKEAVEISNRIAPEHLELAVQNPDALLGKVKHAGSIFLGHQTPQALGDYLAGPNHVLPTGGTARFFSPLSVDDFVKKSSIIAYTREALERVQDPLMKIARVEGLEAHARAVEIRMK